MGLVLGAGGIAGWAWLVGCLAGLEEVAGWDARRADLIVGTSAGAGVAATLRGGRSAIDQLAAYTESARAAASSTPDPPQGASRPTIGHRRSRARPASSPPASTPARAPRGRASWTHGSEHGRGQRGPMLDAGTDRSPETAEPLRRRRPRPAPGRRPCPVGSAAGATMPAPARPPLIERLADDVSHRRHRHPRRTVPPATDGASATAPDGRRAWPQAPQLAVMAFTHWPPRPGLALAGLLPRGRHSLDDLGGRLSRPARPRLAGQAAVGHGHPGRHRPAGRVRPGRRRALPTWPRRCGPPPRCPAGTSRSASATSDHLDGGSWSATNADLVAGLGFDVALILAPMSVATARLGRSKDRLRRAYHRSVLSREVDVVHRNGTDAVVLEPHPDDLALLAGVGRRSSTAPAGWPSPSGPASGCSNGWARTPRWLPPCRRRRRPRSEAGPRAEPGPRPTT